MRNYERMRREAVQLTAECLVSLERVQATTNDKPHAMLMSIEWIEEAEAKLSRAKWLLRQAAAHARKQGKVEALATKMPFISESVWRKLPKDTRDDLLLLLHKDEIVGRPGASTVLYLSRFNVDLAANVAQTLLAAGRKAPAKEAV